MRGTGPVSVNGDTVYAYYTQKMDSYGSRENVGR